MSRPRTTTLVLAGAFVLTLGLYLGVRPDPAPHTDLVPGVPVTTTTDPVTTVSPTPASTPTSTSTSSTTLANPGSASTSPASSDSAVTPTESATD